MENIGLKMGDYNKRNNHAILDVNSLERQVESLWRLNYEVGEEINSPFTKLYNGALKILGKKEKEPNLYKLLTAMDDKMNGLLVQFEDLDLTYGERTASMVKYVKDIFETMEKSIGVKQRMEQDIKQHKEYIENAKKELMKMDKEKVGFYRTTGQAYLAFVDKSHHENLKTALMKNVDLMDVVTKTAVVDLLSVGRTHGVLTGFNLDFQVVVGYFQNAIGLKMYEIQAGQLTANVKRQLEDFGKIVGNFYREAGKGIQELRSIEKGNLLDLSLKKRTLTTTTNSFESTFSRYLSDGKT